MDIAIELTPDRLATATRWAADDGLGGTLPEEAVARFNRLIDAVMHVTGRNRSWSRVAAASAWPDEAAAAGWPPT